MTLEPLPSEFHYTWGKFNFPFYQCGVTCKLLHDSCMFSVGSSGRRLCTREYWTIYRGPGFLASVWFGSSPTPSPPTLPSESSTGDHIGRLIKRDNLAEGDGGGMRQIMRQRESLVFHNSFNTLCSVLTRISKGVTACFAVEPSSLLTAACSQL
jgi:hypothetical protein